MICEGYDPGIRKYFGRTQFHAPEIDGAVYFSSSKKEIPVGTFLNVKIEEAIERLPISESVKPGLYDLLWNPEYSARESITMVMRLLSVNIYIKRIT